MKRFLKSGPIFAKRPGEASLYMFAFVFLCGCTVGCVSASALGGCDLSAAVLRGALSQLASGAGRGEFFSTFKYIFAITFFAFTVYGAAAVPLVVFAKGFFLSLSVSVFVCSCSAGGLAAAAACFLAPEFFSICAVLLAAMPAFNISVSQLSSAFRARGGSTPAFSAEKLPVFALAYALTFAAFLWDKLLTPRIISAVAERIGI